MGCGLNLLVANIHGILVGSGYYTRHTLGHSFPHHGVRCGGRNGDAALYPVEGLIIVGTVNFLLFVIGTSGRKQLAELTIVHKEARGQRRI